MSSLSPLPIETRNADSRGGGQRIADWAGSAWSVVGLMAAAAGVAWLIPRILVLLVPLVAATVFTALLLPLADRAVSKGVPQLGATWLVIAGALGLVAAAVLLIVPVVTQEFGALRTSLGDGITHIENWLVTGPFRIPQTSVDNWSADLRSQTGSISSTLSQGAISKAPLVFHLIAGAILTVVLTFFFIKDGRSIATRLMRQEPPAHQLRWGNVWSSVSGYSSGLVINGLVNAVVLGVALVILGVPFALPLAVITFLASFIPVVGAIVSGILAALVALVAAGPVTSGVVIAVTILIHHLEGYIVGPLVIGRRTGLHPIVLILSLLAGSLIAGVPGAFIAGPIAAATAGWYSFTDPSLPRPSGAA